MKNHLPCGSLAANTRGGSALIAALWTIGLLSLLVMAFALDAHLEGKIVVYTRSKRQADYLTRSGIAIAELVMEKQNKVSGNESVEQAERDRWLKYAVPLKRGQSTVIDEELGGGSVHVEIEPEPSRWNINKLAGKTADPVWEQILTTANLPPDAFGPLIDAFNDWVDKDSLPMPDGAEDDYYRDLEPPYKAKNGFLDTVGELSLVKGFTDTILSGGVLNPEDPPDRQIFVKGIEPLFTIYGDGKINVNAAGMDVLMTIPEMDELLAGAIIEEREGRGESAVNLSPAKAKTAEGVLSDVAFEDFSFKSPGEVSSRIPGMPAAAMQYVDTKSTVFRVTIVGRVGLITRRIQTVVEMTGGKARYLKWREDP